MKLAIIGSRNYPKADAALSQYVESLPPDTILVTGGWPSRPGGYYAVEPTAGVDRAAYRHAERVGLVTVVVSGSQSVFGSRAGVQRNPVIIALADAVAAFWDLKSPGTKRGIRLALETRKSILVLGPGMVQVPDEELRKLTR